MSCFHATETTCSPLCRLWLSLYCSSGKIFLFLSQLQYDFTHLLFYLRSIYQVPSLIAQLVKNPPAMQEKTMAPHSSTLAWKIPWTEEPGGLWSMGSLRVEHDWVTSLSLFTFMHWRRKRQVTPVFLPGEPQGQGSLVGFQLWDHTESDRTEAT